MQSEPSCSQEDTNVLFYNTTLYGNQPYSPQHRRPQWNPSGFSLQGSITLLLWIPASIGLGYRSSQGYNWNFRCGKEVTRTPSGRNHPSRRFLVVSSSPFKCDAPHLDNKQGFLVHPGRLESLQLKPQEKDGTQPEDPRYVQLAADVQLEGDNVFQNSIRCGGCRQ